MDKYNLHGLELHERQLALPCSEYFWTCLWFYITLLGAHHSQVFLISLVLLWEHLKAEFIPNTILFFYYIYLTQTVWKLLITCAKSQMSSEKETLGMAGFAMSRPQLADFGFSLFLGLVYIVGLSRLIFLFVLEPPSQCRLQASRPS
jgi:hypothetical protein